MAFLKPCRHLMESALMWPVHAWQILYQGEGHLNGMRGNLGTQHEGSI